MTLMVVLLGSTVPVTAATPREFYASLLRRGVASYEANRYPDAAQQLRVAAFGLVDTIDQYQLAQIYVTLTFEKLGQHDKARDAAQRVISAERVERRYVGLTVPPAVRTAFEAAASRLLNPADVKTLREGTTAPRQVPQPGTAPRTTTAAPPVVAPQTTAPQTTTQRPASTQASAIPPRTQTATAENIPPQTITPVPPPEAPKPQTVAPKPPPKPATTSKPTTTTTIKPTQSANPAPATVQPQRPSTPATTRPVSAETNGRGSAESARPAASTSAPAVAPAPTPRPFSASEVVTRLAAADRALNSANLPEARRAYRELLGAPGLDHDTLIRLAEGLYRSRDFAGALNAFNRLGTLRRGEEPYRYYIAVAAYETGDSSRAKKELAAALPYIEITPDVARYRGKIESSQ